MNKRQEVKRAYACVTQLLELEVYSRAADKRRVMGDERRALETEIKRFERGEQTKERLDDLVNRGYRTIELWIGYS